MREWPITCQSTTHFQYPVLATDRWIDTAGYKYYYCRRCSVRLGITFRKYGYTWEPLPEPTLDQPSSERV